MRHELKDKSNLSVLALKSSSNKAGSLQDGSDPFERDADPEDSNPQPKQKATSMFSFPAAMKHTSARLHATASKDSLPPSIPVQ